MYPCGCLDHTHVTTQDRDRCVRSDAPPCTPMTHRWLEWHIVGTLRLSTGATTLHERLCVNCGIVERQRTIAET